MKRKSEVFVLLAVLLATPVFAGVAWRMSR